MAKANLKQHYHCMVIEIPEISKLYWTLSPEISIHGIPWTVGVRKTGQEPNQSLVVFLHCANKDESPNWSLWGAASFKLLPFSDDANAIENKTEPYVFNSSGHRYGFTNFIKWNVLFGQDKKYVKDDSINLEVKIMAENPNDPSRSRINFEYFQKCCDNSLFASFRLSVTNVLNLMAVQSPEFKLRGLPCNILITKTRSSHLGAMLRLNKNTGKEPIKIAMSINLVSSMKGVQSIEMLINKQYQYLEDFNTTPILSWVELVKPENGFVNNNSVTLEIKIDSSEPDANETPIAKRAKLNPEHEVKTPQMECPICFKCIAGQNISDTPCGHLFCSTCIKKVVKERGICPSCNKPVQLKRLRRLYLQVIN